MTPVEDNACWECQEQLMETLDFMEWYDHNLQLCCTRLKSQCDCPYPINFEEVSSTEEPDLKDAYNDKKCIDECAYVGTSMCYWYTEWLYTVAQVGLSGDVEKIDVCPGFVTWNEVLHPSTTVSIRKKD